MSSKLKMKRKIVPKSESSETSSEDDSGSSDESSSSEEEAVMKKQSKHKRKHNRKVHSPDREVQKHHRRHKHRKKETEDAEVELRYERMHRKQRKRETHYQDISDIAIKEEPLDEAEHLHRSQKQRRSPNSYTIHQSRGDSVSRPERYRRPDHDEHRWPDASDHRRQHHSDHRRPHQDDHRWPDQDDGRWPDQDDSRRPHQEDSRRPHQDDSRRPHQDDGRRSDQDDGRRPDQDDDRRPDQDDGRRPHLDDHKRPDRRKQMVERSYQPSEKREMGNRHEDTEAQRNGRVRRDRKEDAVKEEPVEKDYEWGKQAERKDADKKNVPAAEKEKPNFGLSGKLAEETNTFKGVVVKYSEPPEARKPKKRWRLYPFKGEKCLPTLYVHRQSAYLIGRDRKIADLPVDHPSCSKQHAVFQYRLLPYAREDGTTGRRIRPYIIDLDSANGTFLNNVKIESRKYVEVLERDVIKFGFSSREYVLLHEHSKDDDADEDVQDDQAGEQAEQAAPP